MKDPYKGKRGYVSKGPGAPVAKMPRVKVASGEEWALSHHAVHRAAQRAGIASIEELIWLLPQASIQMLSKGIKERGGKTRRMMLVSFRDGLGDFVAALEMGDEVPVLLTLMPYAMIEGNIMRHCRGDFQGLEGHLFPGAD